MKSAIPATIFQVKTMARSVRITVDTQENITSDQSAELFSLYEKVGWLFFLNAPDTKIDTKEPSDFKLEPGELSPSGRLRAVLYVYWEQRARDDDFELFYRRWLERTIDQVKLKLPIGELVGRSVPSYIR
jgi:hypothetical protein